MLPSLAKEQPLSRLKQPSKSVEPAAIQTPQPVPSTVQQLSFIKHLTSQPISRPNFAPPMKPQIPTPKDNPTPSMLENVLSDDEEIRLLYVENKDVR